ncbi:MAG: MFS transporter [Candidatus Thermoplasmatota archaeon]|nr:MFS transporter [Candidatus Thermoplasmatota archaeon]
MVQERENGLLKELDETKVNRFHGKAIFVAGMGFFSDAYDLFVISTALPIITSAAVFGSQITSTFVSGMIGAAALFGAFLGAMVFGRIADKKGRKFTYGVEMSILVVFAIISAFSVNVTMLIISRFILGIGIGGDYPISATIMSEYSNVKSRGKLVLSVFAMQGFGLLAGAVVGLVATAYLPLTESWRFMLAFGAIPAASVIYLRRKILETPRYSIEKGNTGLAKEAVEQATSHGRTQVVPSTPKAPNVSSRLNRALANKYWLFLIGTAGSWFIFDMAFYGTSVNSGAVLGLIGFGTVKGNVALSVFHIAEGNTILALAFEVPGYWIAVGLIDKAGRKLLQWAGFSGMAIIYFIFALRFTTIESDLALFVAMYGISFLVGNIGPNSTTFLLPTELFPTNIRTTSHGISAGAGKLGAGIFSFLVLTIISDYGFPVLFDLLAFLAFAGVLLTILAIKETKNMSLEQTSSLDPVMSSPMSGGSGK